MTSPKRAVIFDLDGTLCDSLSDIAAATNFALEALGRATFSVDDYRTMAGNGNELLLQRALTRSSPNGEVPDPATVAKGVVLKMAYQDGVDGHKTTRVFPGIPEMLHALQDAGIAVAVLSNKTEDSVRMVVAEMFPTVQWVYVAGARVDTPLKPDPMAALRIVNECMPGVEPSDCAFVGDTDVDMKTAIAAGMMPIGVPWGFRTESELRANGAVAVVEKAQEIVSLVCGSTC